MIYINQVGYREISCGETVEEALKTAGLSGSDLKVQSEARYGDYYFTCEPVAGVNDKDGKL